MVALTLRSEKGSPLTHNEVDANFVALRDGVMPDGWINVRDYGCVADGVADDTEAFQAAIDALFELYRGGTSYGRGARLIVPYGHYKLTRLNCFREDEEDVFVTTCFRMEGDGTNNTILTFSDPHIGFEIGNSGYFHISGMSFIGTGGAYGAGSNQYLVVIGLLNSAGGTGVYLSKFENCNFGAALVAVSMQAPADPALPALPGEVKGCASEIMFDNCTFGYSGVGVSINQWNALDFIFINCGGSLNITGVYLAGAGGEVTWLGGSWSYNYRDYYYAGTDNITVIGVRSEGYGRFVDSEGSRFTAIGCLIAPHPAVSPGTGLPSDQPVADPTNMVVKHYGGNVTLINCNVRYGKIFSGVGAEHLHMQGCSVTDTQPFSPLVEGYGAINGLSYKIEGCVGTSGAPFNETGIMRRGGDKIPFTYSEHVLTLPGSYPDAGGSGYQLHGLNGQLLISNIATSDPNFAGQVWSDAGTLKISTGNSWSQVYKGSGIKLSNGDASSSATPLPLVKAIFHGSPTPYDWGSVLGTIGKSTGKWYFEAKLINNRVLTNDADSSGSIVGVALNTMVLQGTGGANTGKAGYLDSLGLHTNNQGGSAANTADVYINNTITQNDVTGLGYVEGDIVQVAVDTDADLIWFRLNDTGNWNGGAGTPAAGTGGFSIAAIAGTVYPVVSIATTSGTMDINAITHESVMWQGYFATTNYTAPTGFTNWS